MMRTADSTPGDWSPMPNDMRDPDFAAEAAAQFDEIPARGPYTLAMSNSGLFVSLATITDDYLDIVDKIRALLEDDDDDTAASYLPEEYRDNPEMVAGYKAQLSVLADFFANPDAPSLETAFATGTSMRSIMLHGMSRGTVRLNLASPLDQPILDYRAGSNPIDFDLHLAHLRFLLRMIDTPTMQEFGTTLLAPNASIIDDDAALLQYSKESMVLSFMHPCCTSAMMPKAKGGVVGTDLRVHGAAGLRVADISVLPLLPSSHTSQQAYAIGEKVRCGKCLRICSSSLGPSMLTDCCCRLPISSSRTGVNRPRSPSARGRTCGRHDSRENLSLKGFKVAKACNEFTLVRILGY